MTKRRVKSIAAMDLPEPRRADRDRMTAVPRNRALLLTCSVAAALTGACGSRTLLSETSGETPPSGETAGGRGHCVGTACAAERVWTASSFAFRLQVFNKHGIFLGKAVCERPTSDFSYELATRTLTDHSCYVTAVGAGSFTVDPSTADAIVALLQSIRLVDQTSCAADMPTYVFEVLQDPGSNRTFQDCAPNAIPTPPFLEVEDLVRLDRLLTDVAQQARDAGK